MMRTWLLVLILPAHGLRRSSSAPHINAFGHPMTPAAFESGSIRHGNWPRWRASYNGTIVTAHPVAAGHANGHLLVDDVLLAPDDDGGAAVVVRKFENSSTAGGEAGLTMYAKQQLQNGAMEVTSAYLAVFRWPPAGGNCTAGQAKLAVRTPDGLVHVLASATVKLPPPLQLSDGKTVKQSTTAIEIICGADLHFRTFAMLINHQVLFEWTDWVFAANATVASGLSFGLYAGGCPSNLDCAYIFSNFTFETS